MVEIFGPIPARPPTPPRPGSHLDHDQPESLAIVQTPGDSPREADSSRAPPSSRGSKRVTFSPWLHTTIDPQSSNKSKPKDSPFKSILKETNSPIPVWSPNVDTFTAESLAMLLESVIQQLAGESITSRLDAYMQFFGALRTYDGLPAGKDIAGKLRLITDFIQRDVTRDLINGTPLDTNLANQALKLSAAFVWHADISTQLSEEFKVFIVEHTITCLQEAKAPKSVLTHYMSILSTQSFGPKVLTNARVTRLLAALQDISNHVTGKAIALHRLSIYQRLLTQSKPIFLSQSSLWAEHLIFGLLHHMKDTRLKAITLGFQVSIAVGSSNPVSKTIRDIFDRSLENDRRLVTEVRERLSRMMASSESGVHVPQVWGIIILLLRTRNWNLEKWEHFKDWVLVLQKCFNCSEPAIKAQAILSWNRFVFAVGPDETTTSALLKMLGKPIISQFDRKKSDKSGSTPTQLAVGSYYNLLYYAFRPSLPHGHLDLVWEEYVANPSAAVFSAVPVLGNEALRAVANLLWSTQAKMWTETRIIDTNRIEADELPSVDPKWVRSRVSSIVRVFESLLKASVWNDDAPETSNAALAWGNLCSALSLASSKEITPSGESMHAVASLLAVLHRLWVAGPPSLNASGADEINSFFDRFRFLATTVIVSLGGISFTEKLLFRATDETFQVANSLAHSSPGMTLESPILHLLRVISATSTTAKPTTSYTQLVEATIEASCKGKISRGSRLELLQSCAVVTTAETSDPRMRTLLVVVWKATARAAADALRSFPIESARERDGSVSKDYENVNKILLAGLPLLDVHQEWSQLLEAYVRVARTERGDRVLATLIIEPVANGLMDLPARGTCLPSASLLGHSLSIPFSQEDGIDMDVAVAESNNLPPFPKKLLESIGRTLRLVYEDFDGSETQILATFIESLTSFLGSGAPKFRFHALENLQPSLCLWVKDETYKFDANNGIDSRILTSCRALSSVVLSILQILAAGDSTSVGKFESIICAGFESRHRTTTQKFVDWYSTRDGQVEAPRDDTVEKSAKEALNRLGHSAENNQDTVQMPSSVQQAAAPPADSYQNLGSARLFPQAFDQVQSSPVIGVTDASLPEIVDLTEPQLPTNNQPDAEEQIGDGTTVPFQGNRREMFRMIESIRSSSPAHPQGKLGFETPVHLRRTNTIQANGLPPTPLLAPTENEEAFINSSPTPATRDPTPASKSNLLDPHDVPMNDATDIPSSPPELDSRSPSPQKRSSRLRSARRRNSRAKKALARNSIEGQNNDSRAVNSPSIAPQAADAASFKPAVQSQKEPSAQPSPSRRNDRHPNGRFRSALTQSTDNDQNTPPAAPGTPEKQPGSQSIPNSRSKSASKRRRRRQAANSAAESSQQPPEQSQLPSVLTVAEPAVDSSSEELETQIASQLEQDLELAVDFGDASQDKQMGDATPMPVSRKRKREEEDTHSTNAKEKRRSTRLSSAKDMVPAHDDQNTNQSQDVVVPGASEDTPVANTSSTAPRRTTRSSQRKDEQAEIAQPILEPSNATPQASKRQLSRPTSKRSRKSIHLDDLAVSSAAVETPSSEKSARSTRSRNTRSSQHAAQSQLSQGEAPQPDSSTTKTELPQAGNYDSEIIPDSVTLPGHMVHDASLISTEEAYSQPTETASAIIPSIQPELAATVATAGIQTDPPAIPEPDISEGGIKQSLHRILRDMKSAILGPAALREVDDLLFNIRVEAHDASRRHNHSA
ncbi:hypothetical protein N7492_005605 [Penicillium capsulatum]|uniref:Telomere-associated protein Rif1 N-terminal domain-containing protein n=1 Tax=Penicillium capsulatum TaxID=69766 RepID=A0A9W9IG31_9EURO|nr:hypothetical protein N7492_005605 [Penicillium capsulatum]